MPDYANMGQHLSDYNEVGRNQVGSNPPDEPHIYGGVRGPSGANLGDFGGGGWGARGQKLIKHPNMDPKSSGGSGGAARPTGEGPGRLLPLREANIPEKLRNKYET